MKFLRTPFFTENFRWLLLYVGTTVLQNIVVRSGEKHNHNKVSYNYLGSSTQADHNSRRSQYSLVICNVQKPGIFIIVFLPKEQKSIV